MAEPKLPDALRICEEALAREGAERASYLEAACLDRPDLRREVDSLIAGVNGGSFLERPPWAAPALSLVAGDRLGPYEIAGPPLVGGMGTVYRARDIRLGRQVALKVIGGGAWMADAARARFKREARAIASLDHPHICALYDVGSASPQGAGGMVIDYLVMEYLEGQTLGERLQVGRARGAGSALTVDEAVTYGIQIADALATAHHAGIVHRDLKPANIMLTVGQARQGPPHAKLLDFGLAKQEAALVDSPAETASLPPATVPGMVMGTLGYQSPEQARGEEVDARSDLFAFGAVFYEMLTGEAAFKRPTGAETIAAVLGEDPPAPSSVNANVPASCDAVVAKALEKDRALRYQSAADLMADLLRIRRELTGRSSSPSLKKQAEDEDRPRAKGAGLRAVAVALGALAAVAVVGWAVYALVRPSAGVTLPTVSTREISRGTGLDTEPAFAPDGLTVAYVAEDGTNTDIWLTDARGGSVQRWTTNPGVDRHPAWSADGTRIYFESDRNGKRGIYEAPRLNSDLAILLIPGGREPSVSPDGTRLAYTVGAPGDSDRIAVASLHALSSTRVITARGSGLSDHGGPTWSPDGSEICYMAWDGLWVIPATGGAARQLTHGMADAHPTWSASGFVYFSSWRGGVWQLWRVSADGSGLATVTAGLGTEQCPSVSRDGRALAFSSATAGRHVAIRDLESRVERAVGGGGEQGYPSFSPSGRSLYMNVGASSRREIWVQRILDGVPDGPPRPLPLRFIGASPSVVSQATESPDGRWVAFLGITGEERDIWVAPAEGGTAVNFTDHPGRDMHPAWSPDGSRLAFSSERESGMHIWLQALRDGQPAGEPTRLTAAVAEEQWATWSPDGERIAFVTAAPGGGREVATVAAAGRATPTLVTSGAEAWRVKWMPEGWLLVSGWQADGGVISLRAVDAVRGTIIGSFPPIVLGTDMSTAGFDVSHDGRSLALVRGRGDGRIGVLEAKSGRF